MSKVYFWAVVHLESITKSCSVHSPLCSQDISAGQSLYFLAERNNVKLHIQTHAVSSQRAHVHIHVTWQNVIETSAAPGVGTSCWQKNRCCSLTTKNMTVTVSASSAASWSRRSESNVSLPIKVLSRVCCQQKERHDLFHFNYIKIYFYLNYRQSSSVVCLQAEVQSPYIILHVQTQPISIWHGYSMRY